MWHLVYVAKYGTGTHLIKENSDIIEQLISADLTGYSLCRLTRRQTMLVWSD